MKGPSCLSLCAREFSSSPQDVPEPRARPAHFTQISPSSLAHSGVVPVDEWRSRVGDGCRSTDLAFDRLVRLTSTRAAPSALRARGGGGLLDAPRDPRSPGSCAIRWAAGSFAPMACAVA